MWTGQGKREGKREGGRAATGGEEGDGRRSCRGQNFSPNEIMSPAGVNQQEWKEEEEEEEDSVSLFPSLSLSHPLSP